MASTITSTIPALFDTVSGKIHRIERNKFESKENKYDLIVIGGGINGTAIARDASERGLKVLLLEKNDFGSGCSSGSSRLIHGGLRYLEHLEFSLVRESLRERELLLRNANHLVRPMEMVIPIYEGDARGYRKIQLGMMLYDLLSFDKSLPSHKMLRKNELIKYEPAIKEDGLVGGAVFYDAQVAFAERLCIENMLMAENSKATILNHAEVVDVNLDGKQISQVTIYDHLSGETYQASGKLIVNAAGPWVDEVCGITGQNITKQMGGTKGIHIVVKLNEGAPKRTIYSTTSNKRAFFIIPWREYYLIGTTDEEFSGDLDSVKASTEEIEYLIKETNRILKSTKISTEDILFSYAHVRPLPFQPDVEPSKKTRKHMIHNHAKDGIVNFDSIIGGKLTTARELAEEYVDHGIRKIGAPKQKTKTKDIPMIGATCLDIETFKAQQKLRAHEKYRVAKATAEHLIDIYGRRYNLPLILSSYDRSLLHRLDPDSPDIRAQVHFAILEESAYSVRDVFGRIGIGLSPVLDSTQAIDYVASQLIDHYNYKTKAVDNQIADYMDNVVSRKKI